MPLWCITLSLLPPEVVGECFPPGRSRAVGCSSGVHRPVSRARQLSCRNESGSLSAARSPGSPSFSGGVVALLACAAVGRGIALFITPAGTATDLGRCTGLRGSGSDEDRQLQELWTHQEMCRNTCRTGRGDSGCRSPSRWLTTRRVKMV